MGKVRIEISPSVASMLKMDGSDWFILERQIREGGTVADVLTDVALDYTRFRKVVFDPDTGTLNDNINVVLNDSLLQSPDVSSVRLNDGDILILLTVFSGG